MVRWAGIGTQQPWAGFATASPAPYHIIMITLDNAAYSKCQPARFILVRRRNNSLVGYHQRTNYGSGCVPRCVHGERQRSQASTRDCLNYFPTHRSVILTDILPKALLKLCKLSSSNVRNRRYPDLPNMLQISIQCNIHIIVLVRDQINY